MTTETKRSLVIAEDLGEDAMTAIKTGHAWSYKPESAEGYDGFCRAFDDDDRKVAFEEVFYVHGFEVRDGKLFDEVWEVDTDSGWDFLEECDVDDPGYEEWLKEYDHEAQRASWEPYYEHVVETGEDPLGIFFVNRSRKQQWTAKLTQGEGRITLVGAHKRSLAYIPRVAESDPAKLPETVREFLCLDSDGNIQGIRTVEEIRLDCCDKAERVDGGVVVTFTVDEPIDPELVKMDVRNHAQAALERD